RLRGRDRFFSLRAAQAQLQRRKLELAHLVQRHRGSFPVANTSIGWRFFLFVLPFRYGHIGKGFENCELGGRALEHGKTKLIALRQGALQVDANRTADQGLPRLSLDFDLYTGRELWRLEQPQERRDAKK